MILKRLLSKELSSFLFVLIVTYLAWKHFHKVKTYERKVASIFAKTSRNGEFPYFPRGSVHSNSVSQVQSTTIEENTSETGSWVWEEVNAEMVGQDSVLEEAMKLLETAVHEYRIEKKPPRPHRPPPSQRSPHLPWYMSRGSKMPTPSLGNTSLLSCGPDCEADRILEQLQFVPRNVSENSSKTICLKNWPKEETVYSFENLDCPVSSCNLFQYCKDEEADAIVFRDEAMINLPKSHPPEQVWILFTLESPASLLFSDMYWRNIRMNWTASYNRESDIVTPYSYWVNYKGSEIDHYNLSRRINYAENKTKQAIWIVSHCNSSNKREKYVEELKKYIEVDTYGNCGISCNNTECPLEQFKFYLAFENSNCRDYITEKMLRGYTHNVLPIVMGARPEDYARVAPARSYIHVDEFKSPRDLADYLQLLDTDDHLYNSYFHWKGTGEFIDTSLWCRLCALLHADYPAKWYDGFEWLLKRSRSCFKTTIPVEPLKPQTRNPFAK